LISGHVSGNVETSYGHVSTLAVRSSHVLRTTSISPGYVRTELADSIDDPRARDEIRKNMAEFAIPPDAVARAIAFAIEQPHDVEIGDITIRPTIQG
jgi:NADP-dependent 3-hydroxy acid dehydrogenase YdfG